MIPADPRLPTQNIYTREITQRLVEVWRQMSAEVNKGLMWASSGTGAPTTGAWALSDMVKNEAPVELGLIGAKYIIIGWVCVSSGTPGTWKEMRTLTGA